MSIISIISIISININIIITIIIIHNIITIIMIIIIICSIITLSLLLSLSVLLLLLLHYHYDSYYYHYNCYVSCRSRRKKRSITGFQMGSGQAFVSAEEPSIPINLSYLFVNLPVAAEKEEYSGVAKWGQSEWGQ